MASSASHGITADEQTQAQVQLSTPDITATPVTREDPKDEETVVADQADHDPTLKGHKLYAVVVGICFGALMMSLDISIIGTVSVARAS